MKETKRLYLALLVLAVGFFWCMCAGLFWPAQAAEDPEKGAREAVRAAVAAEGGRDWDAFLELQCAATCGGAPIPFFKAPAFSTIFPRYTYAFR